MPAPDLHDWIGVTKLKLARATSPPISRMELGADTHVRTHTVARTLWLGAVHTRPVVSLRCGQGITVVDVSWRPRGRPLSSRRIWIIRFTRVYTRARKPSPTRLLCMPPLRLIRNNCSPRFPIPPALVPPRFIRHTKIHVQLGGMSRIYFSLTGRAVTTYATHLLGVKNVFFFFNARIFNLVLPISYLSTFDNS